MKVIGYLDSEHLFEAYVDDFCHVTRSDGGHIRLRAARPGIANIENLNEEEINALGGAIQRLTKAMKAALTANGVDIRRINIQYNNNWSDLYRTKPSFCIHFYGRAYDSAKQPFGQSLYFPSPREHKDFYKDNEPITDEDINLIRTLLSEML